MHSEEKAPVTAWAVLENEQAAESLGESGTEETRLPIPQGRLKNKILLLYII